MKIARSWKEFFLGLVALFFLSLAFANIIADRCSLNLESCDLTWDEIGPEGQAAARSFSGLGDRALTQNRNGFKTKGNLP